ncbi:hypothetical protein H0H81_012054 [Sphagnurus paluster]|uniref:Glutamine amidotransferase domain-containing protein n=1 Tax=Sphagnurus paluster TaxID=117069 RepID=A0A9P7K3J3_9AGAR|nr:hypothetical protein H0H81_012054 [Sphagnurus paluster]
MPTKIALLVTGSIPEPLRAEFGTYHTVYTEFLRRAHPVPGTEFVLDAYDVVEEMEYPSNAQLDGYYDAVMYTGSAASAYDDVPWINTLVAFSAHVATEKPHIKIIAICFGHQILARALGGECVPNNGIWEVGPTPLDLTDLGKRLFGVDTLNIQQMHRDHVPSVPPSFHLLASTPVSPNQGMVRFAPNTHTDTETNTDSDLDLDAVQILTLQGHPEYVAGIVRGLVTLRVAAGIMSAELGADVERRLGLGWREDGVGVLGRAVWRVLGARA